MNILVVDDHALNRKLLAAQLEGDGHSVVTAEDGIEGLAVLERERVDLIISDILMPRLDGFAFCQRIRSDARWAALPFIFATNTYNSPGDERAAKLVGADCYLMKPVPIDVLRRAMAEAAAITGRPRRDTPADELLVMREYNVALVRKLEEKNAELTAKLASLESAEQTLRLQTTALESTASGVVITDTAGRIIWVNPAFTVITGFGADEAMGATMKLIKSGQHDPEFYRRLWATIRAGETWRGEFINRRRDGTLYHAAQIITPVRAAAGEIVRYIGIMNDVTAQRRAEVEKQLAEERYRHIFENSIEGLFQSSPDGRLLAANPALARMFGYRDVEDVMARGLDLVRDVYVQPEQRDIFKQILARDGRVTGFECRLRRRDGSTLWALANARVVADATGAEAFFEGSVVDITAQKEVAENLRTSELRFRTLAETIREVFWLTDPGRQTMLYVSPAYEKIWGRSGDSLRADPTLWIQSIHPDDRERIQEAIRATREDGTYDEEYRILQPGGEVRWIRDRAFPARDEGGRVTHLAGVAEDITERRQTDARLLEQARLLDLASDSISERDLADRLLYWNKGSERLYGWRSDEVLGRPALEILQTSPGDFRRAKETVLRDGTWFGELHHAHRSGARLVVNSRWTLVRDEGGAPRSILVINTDVTERKSLEAQFFRAQRVEAIGMLASGIAHDLNNILAPVMMSAPLLRWNLPPKEVEQIIGSIEGSARRGADLVRQLLTFSRGVEGDRGVIQTALVVKEVARVVRQTFPRNIELQTEAPLTAWRIRADPTQIHQVLLNLAVNARDAMPDGGSLSFSLHNAAIDENFSGMMPAARPGEYLLIRVKDTGSGIPPDIVDRIFDPFFTTKQVGRGTGLGLSTVAGIVKSHGGFITLNTVVGKGTEFLVYFPAVADSGHPLMTPDAVPLPRGAGELLLVVDDEPSIRDVVKETLVRYGYEVVTASDGAEATAQYAGLAGRVRAVITDLDMPIMDGMAMIMVLRKLTPDLRVVVSSGIASLSQLEARRAALRAQGIERILFKPYLAEDLLRTVHAALHD